MRRRTIVIVFAVIFTPACTSLLGDFSSTASEAIDASSEETTKRDGGGSLGDAGKPDRRDGGRPKAEAGEAGEEAEAGQANDGGGRVEAGEAGEAGAALTAVASGATVWVDQPATVSGSKGRGTPGKATFAWSVLTRPTGSAVTNASLSSLTTAATTFTPDVMGDYVLKLTVTDGKETATADATVVAVPPQVFYSKSTALTASGVGDDDGGGGSNAFYVGDFDGKTSHAVNCATPLLNGSGGGLPLGVWPLFSANFLDFWEGEAGAPYAYAGFAMETFDAGDAAVFNVRTQLLAGTNASSCDASPPVLLGMWAATDTPTLGFASEPRFNADGTRIAFRGDDLRIRTIAVAGGLSTLVASYFENDSTGAAVSFDVVPGTAVNLVPRPAWYQGTSVAWARPTSAAAWEVVRALDESTAPVSVYMTCAGITPREIYLFSNGDVMASYRTSTTGPVNLTLFKTDSAQKCTAVRSYSNLSHSSLAGATGFSVSQDESWVAFLQYDPAIDDASIFGGDISAGFLYVAPVDGSSPPVRVSNDLAIYGPRWIGGGHLLAFTRLDHMGADASAVPTSIVVISPESGASTVVESADGVQASLAMSSAMSCTGAARPAGAGGLALFSVAAAAGVSRRRRRRPRPR